ncbi:MAG: carboxymuconolactone decarboxylase family protein, partial [Actinomycetes bacterium]
VLKHAVRGFALYRGEGRVLPPELRELAQARAGWATGSQFVFSQHCKSCRALGIDEAKIDGIPAWQVSERFNPIERAVLAYADGLALDRGRVADNVITALRDALSDEQVLELTYITAMYVMHATMSRALHLEFDDAPERIVEVPGPHGSLAARDVGADIAGPRPGPEPGPGSGPGPGPG